MIKPTAYLRKLEGKSNAHLISFNDGKDYVVKFFQEGFEKSLPNEWVGYCIARYLGLPVPFARIVEIPQEFCSQMPELASLNLSKHQFASLFVPDCKDGHQVSKVSSIVNHERLAGNILFDYWLYNRDRTRKNILLQEEGPDTYRLWAIDHAEVFGSFDWKQEELEVLPDEMIKSATHELMTRFIVDEIEFLNQLELIQTFPILLLEEIVSLIPDDWNVTKEEQKAMVTTLLRRRKETLPKLMKRFVKKVYYPIQEHDE